MIRNLHQLILTFFVWSSRSITFQNNKLSLFSTKFASQCIFTFYNFKVLCMKGQNWALKVSRGYPWTLSVFKVAWYGPLPPHKRVCELYALDILSWLCQKWPFLKLTYSSSAPFRSIKYLNAIEYGVQIYKVLTVFLFSFSFPCKVCIPNLVDILT